MKILRALDVYENEIWLSEKSIFGTIYVNQYYRLGDEWYDGMKLRKVWKFKSNKIKKLYAQRWKSQ